MMYALIGFSDISNRDLMVIAFLMLLASIVLAWVIDLVASRMSYGFFGNCVIVFGAIYGGLALYQRYFGATIQAESVTLIAVVLGTVLGTFFFLALIGRLRR
jgi:hypothetical protein